MPALKEAAMALRGAVIAALILGIESSVGVAEVEQNGPRLSVAQQEANSHGATGPSWTEWMLGTPLKIRA